MTWLAGSPQSGIAIVPMAGIPIDGDAGKFLFEITMSRMASDIRCLSRHISPELRLLSLEVDSATHN